LVWVFLSLHSNPQAFSDRERKFSACQQVHAMSGLIEAKASVTTPNDKVEQAELDRLGISRVPADVFLWGGYRYSNARDAVAAARRGARS